jgi:2-dehydropantoate 2-reductase
VLPERLVGFGDVYALEICAVREVREVMKARGIAAIDLPRYPVRTLFAVASLPVPVAKALLAQRIAGARGRKPPSLLLDLRAGKARTEVDVLSGAVAAAAREAGVAAPVNAAYARVVSEIAERPQRWADYRDHPEALAAEVAAEKARSLR